MISRRALASRFVQLAFNCFTVVTGFCTFLPLGYIWKYFSQCVLYADLDASIKENMTLKVVVHTSVWGTSTNCNFATYVPVVAAIHAFIWCWFFLLMKATLKEENREHYLLLPSLLLHSIMLLVVFVTSSIISAGGDTFCRNLRRKLDSKYTCSEAFTMMRWDLFKGQKHNIFRFLQVAKFSSWLMTLTILAQCLLTGYKLYRWFLEVTPREENSSPRKKNSSQNPNNSSPLTSGSDNCGYLDSDDSSNKEDDFIHHDETGSLIRVF